MDKHLKLLNDSLQQAHIAMRELQQARPMDPRFVRFNRLLWVVSHCVDAAAAASIDLTAELVHLRDHGVNL